MSPADKLAQGVAALGLRLAPDIERKLLAYVALVAKWNRVHNLTAVRAKSQMVSAHLLDCIAVAPYLEANTVLDVGSGAGLPGIPLALMWPHVSVALIDSNHKKAAFLRQAVIELELKNATVIGERVENWQPPHLYDLVISRAFSDLPEFLRIAGRMCAEKGTVATMKGVYPHEELAQLPPDFKLRRVERLSIPGLPAERHLLLLSPVR
jgi:16S rRNA (guanine527-N7)-methyltransferase